VTGQPGLAERGENLCRVYSRDKRRAEAFAQKHDARAAYSQLGDLLGDSRVDGVFVCSPNAFHASHELAWVGAAILVVFARDLTPKSA